VTDTDTGVPGGPATPGSTISDVAMLDANGEPVSQYAAMGGRPAVIVVYRGAWCPHCNLALKVYRGQLHPRLVEQGITLIAVSPQKPDGSLSMQEKHNLQFPVLSDPGNALASELGILVPPRIPEIRAAHEARGLHLEELNADGTERLPMPTVVVADAGHRIRWIDAHPDHTTRTDATDVLTAVDTWL